MCAWGDARWKFSLECKISLHRPWVEPISSLWAKLLEAFIHLYIYWYSQFSILFGSIQKSTENLAVSLVVNGAGSVRYLAVCVCSFCVLYWLWPDSPYSRLRLNCPMTTRLDLVAKAPGQVYCQQSTILAPRINVYRDIRTFFPLTMDTAQSVVGFFTAPNIYRLRQKLG